MSNVNTPNQAREAFYEQLKIFGDAWMLIIVSELLTGSYRFNELHRRVGSISPVTLTSRLKKLEQLGIITRTVKIEDQLSVTYRITDKGRALELVLLAIRDFSNAYTQAEPENTLKSSPAKE